MSTQNIRPFNLKGGTGGIIKEICPFLWVASGGKQISDPIGDRNSSSVPGTSGMILPAHAGVKILIFAGVDEKQPPKVDQIFGTIFVKSLKRSPRKTGTPRNLVHVLLCREMSSVSNEYATGTLCTEGAERRPPKHDCHLCEKPANFSPRLLTPLECAYETFDTIVFLAYPSPIRRR